MSWPNFAVTFFFIIIVLIKQCCATDQDVYDTMKLINLCIFIEGCLVPEEALVNSENLENLAVIECGKSIEDARKQRSERGIGGAGPSDDGSAWHGMKKTFQKWVNKKKSNKKRRQKYRQILDACLDRLVDRSEQRPNKDLVMQIGSYDLKYFDELLKNGRAFIKRITYQANYEIGEDFFIHLIETLLNPLTSAEIIVEDIGIGTATTGLWDRDILIETLNEKFFDEMTYNTGAIPHWEVLYDLDKEIKAKMHFCQWASGQGQKFRMWRFKKKDDIYTKAMAFIKQEMTTPEKQQIKDTEKLIDTCKWIEDHLAPEEAYENLAVIKCGKAIEDARRLRYERRIGGAVPSSSRPSSSRVDSLTRIRQKLDACLNRLVDKSEQRPSKELIMQIEEKKLKEFDKLLKNGRAFIERITYRANYQIKQKFFIDLIETLLNPLTSSQIIVEDIGIGTTTVVVWDRGILMQTLNDKYLDEITFHPGEKAYWEVLYDLDKDTKAKTHFCQFGMGQMIRMWRYENKEDPIYMKPLAFIKNKAITPEICF
uniref:Non-specific serine/threonine protein kinase n=1 Tax=Globodera pallida TaxID=36090 RepID=A0A183BJ58_GLOPA